MSVTEQPTRVHPVAAFADGLNRTLTDLAEAPLWSMTPEEHRAALLDLARGSAALSALRLRVLASADGLDVAAESAAASTAAWLAHETRQDRTAAHADVRLARALETTYECTRTAFATGHVDDAQARVIVRSVEALPESVGPVLRVRAEQHLVRLAAQHDAAALKRLGRKVFEVVDPEAADLEEGRRLDAEERAAARATYLHLNDNGDGTSQGRFRISTLHAAMLDKALASFTNPRRDPQRDVPRSALSRPELRGRAFCELLERFPTSRLPRIGGGSASVVVLLDYDKLLSGLGVAQLDTGQDISAGLARRLACEAGVIPAVYRHALGGPSEILDLGRRRRLHTSAHRVALTVRDRGCTAEGCDRPAASCHAHHEVPWSEGGGTSTDNGRLLCPFHHGKAHSPTYEMKRLPGGQVRFHRRT